MVRVIERDTRDLDLPMTVLKPVFPFQNLEAFVEIGHASAIGEGDPGQFVGEGYDLASRRADARPRPRRPSHRSGVDVDPDHLPIERAYDSFGFEFTTLEEYLREHGCGEKEEPAATPGWVRTL